MRLLNVDTLQFREFHNDDIPPYLVTSHRWCDNETTYKDVLKQRNNKTEGYQKVVSFCKFVQSVNASQKGKLVVPWIWIDTCCIDQRSSAEVSESINSMWTWYSGSTHCYAYLRDVRPLKAGWDAVMFDFRNSEWFTRGWTLQELLAPPCVIFLTKDWEVIGTRNARPGRHQCPVASSTQSLEATIVNVTGIPQDVLSNFERLRNAVPNEVKMAWAANRRTTRPEDAAYCLLGIFEVHMPLIYGEGEHNARRRLELELVKTEQERASLKDGFSYFLPAQKQPLSYRHYTGQQQAQPGSQLPANQSEEVIQPEDTCPICARLLLEPLTTSCSHTTCESCFVSDSKWSLLPVPLDLQGRAEGEAAAWNFAALTKCPVCNTVDMDALLASPNSEVALGLRYRYPHTYAQRLAELEETDDPSIKILTMHIGNWHRLIRKGHHYWSFFLKPSRTDIIKEVRLKLHESFPEPLVFYPRPPYVFHGQGWGYFEINVHVILQGGYVWLSDDVQPGSDGTLGLESTLEMKWTLDFESFDGRGAQGKCRVKVKKITAGV